MPETRKNVTITVADNSKIDQVADALRAAGLQNVTELSNIGIILGEWHRPLDELLRIRGVEAVEEQMSGYRPS